MRRRAETSEVRGLWLRAGGGAETHVLVLDGIAEGREVDFQRAVNFFET